MTKKELREKEIKEAKEKLIEWLNQTKDKTIHYSLKQVSQSGMKRAISFHIIVDNEILNIDYWISKVMDLYPIDKKYGGLKVTGCGMDMGFSVIYNLGRTLYPNGDGKTLSKRSHVDGLETDGGFLLTSRWI